MPLDFFSHILLSLVRYLDHIISFQKPYSFLVSQILEKRSQQTYQAKTFFFDHIKIWYAYLKNKHLITLSLYLCLFRLVWPVNIDVQGIEGKYFYLLYIFSFWRNWIVQKHTWKIKYLRFKFDGIEQQSFGC